ncbi:hypothetical protein [Pseudomonas fluorescens]|nr:hypothetical protein [Pseudomonas fluorescens]
MINLNAIALMGMLLTTSALAEVVQITAKFAPDPSRPYVNEFENTTISSGFCAANPNSCKMWNMFSIGTRINFNSITPIRALHTERQGPMFSAPAAWKDVAIQDSTGRDGPNVQIRISGVGAIYQLSDRAQVLIGEELDSYSAHKKLWSGGDWGISPRPCLNSPGGGTVSDLDKQYGFFWFTPRVGVCATQAQYDIPGFSYIDLDFAYELKTPNPLKMVPGIYTGRAIYTIGPGLDFDMGDTMQPTDSTIQLDFTLTVDHVFNVEIPPGGNKVALLPEGGWQAWLNQGRRPVRLFRDQTFNIWTSTPFKMSMECQYSQDGNTCSLREPVSGHVVPLNVNVSLPHGLTDAGGQSVNRRQLLRDGSGTELFQPGFYVDRKPGTLHFEIPPGEVAEMIRPGQPRQYSGNVTVIWDSDI